MDVTILPTSIEPPITKPFPCSMQVFTLEIIKKYYTTLSAISKYMRNGLIKLSKTLCSDHVAYNAQRVNARHYIKLIF